MSCLFCRIIAGEIPASKIYEDDRLFAFNDINPQAPMHVLVVPKQHIATLNDLTAAHDGLVGAMVRAAADIAKERATTAPATGPCSTATRRPDRRYFTSTCMCWADAR